MANPIQEMLALLKPAVSKEKYLHPVYSDIPAPAEKSCYPFLKTMLQY